MADAAPPPRHDWIDLAKAVSILLVVLYHALLYAGSFPWSQAAPAARVWDGVAEWCMPLRLPLFFFASGLLAAPSLTRPTQIAMRKRVVGQAWLYLVWGAIFALTIPRWPMSGPSELPTLYLFGRYLLGLNPAWYLWALPFAFLFGWATRQRSTGYVIGIAAVLALLPIEHFYSANLLRCLVFYLIGLRLPHLADVVTRSASGKAIVLAAIAFAALGFVGIQFLSDIAGVALIALVCVIATRHSQLVRQGGLWFAKRTLPIYVLQFPLLTMGAFALDGYAPIALLRDDLFASAFPVILSVVVTLAALGLHALAIRTPLKVLFTTPGRVEDAVAGMLARRGTVRTDPA